MIAVSVPGITGSHSALSSSVWSVRSGLILTNSMPRPASAEIEEIDECSPVPPESICRFFSGIPPNDTTSLVFSAMVAKVVPGPLIAVASPSTCGVITEPAALE